jgi:integral membrane protein (TIGR01906 family)
MRIFHKVVFFVILLSLPLVIVIGSIRLILTPLFLEVDYRLPGFPADPFGFSFSERMSFARLSSEYLINTAGIEFLADLKMGNGQPLYNQRELSHMLDVKNLTQIVLKVWYGLAGLFFVVLFYLWRTGSLGVFWKALAGGGWLTIGLVAVIILGVLINFDALFTGFHRIFFSGDTWLFYVNDSLIRLFPERLWTDVFYFIGGLSLSFAILSIYLGRRFAKEKH